MRSSSRIAVRLLICACLSALGSKPCEAQYGGPIHAGGFGGGSSPKPVYGAPVDPNAAIEIASEPKVIDPATLLPPEMAAKVTLTFDKMPLSDVVTTLKEKLAIDVILDEMALTDEGIDLDFPVSTRANDEPVYLLLDRMMGRSLAWDFRDGVLTITTPDVRVKSRSIKGYDLSGLLNAGYSARQLEQLLFFTSSDPWEFNDGYGGALSFVGDSLVVYQTEKSHREIAGILAALRTPARQTFIGQASQSVQLREFFKHPVAVEFDQTPLDDALASLSETIGSTIHIDELSLSDNGIPVDAPVTLSLHDKPLHVVLDHLLAPLDLSCIVANAELLVTTTADAEELMTLALYDVRDICRNEKTSRQLLSMIEDSTGGQWDNVDGIGGGMAFARPGILIVQQTGPLHDEIFAMIEQLRTLRRQAEPAGERPWERMIETRFHRVPVHVANFLESNLPKLIAPETWRSDERPDAPGTIERISAAPMRLGFPHSPPPKKENEESGKNSDKEKPEEAQINTAVLAIRQTVDVHEEIPALLHRVKDGDGNYSKWGPCGYGFSQVNEPFRSGPLPVAPPESSIGVGND